MFVSIITPIKNSEALIQIHYEAVIAVLKNTGFDYEILYIDDGSSDHSPKIIKDLSESESNVYGFRLHHSQGQQTAVAVGHARAKGDVIVTLDVDLEVPACVIPDLVHQVENGNDYVPACRITKIDRGLTRRIGSWVFNAWMRLRTGLPIHDFSCGASAKTKSLSLRMQDSRIPYLGLKHLAGQLADSIYNYPVNEIKIFEVKSSYNMRLLFRAFAVEHKLKTGFPKPPPSMIDTIHV